jgi:hypothetical protein
LWEECWYNIVLGVTVSRHHRFVQGPGLSRIALVLCRVKHVLRLPSPLDTQNNPVTLIYDPSASSFHHCYTWRWVFYLNLPFSGVCLVMLYFFLQVNNPEREIGLRTKLARIDWIRNFLLISLVSGILVGLSWGGSTYAWSSWHVLVSLCTGFAGLALFTIYEGSFIYG